MMPTSTTTRKPAGWRINPTTINRVREAAKREHISANDYVERVLTEATKHIETEEERKERLHENNCFLDRFAGTWSGTESTDEIMKAIKSGSTPKEVIEL